MNEDAKALLKNSSSNLVTVLGYVSTAATFLPFMVVVRPFLLPLGLLLIIVGTFRGAVSIIKEKNARIETVASSKDAEIQTVRAEKDVQIAALDVEIAALNERITELSRKPYSQDLERVARQVLQNEMTLQGRLIVRHLMIHEPVEVGRVLIPDIPQDRTHAELGIAMKHGIVQHKQEREGTLRTHWIINPRFRPVLQDVLYEDGML